jgi:hypothetical protein
MQSQDFTTEQFQDFTADLTEAMKNFIIAHFIKTAEPTAKQELLNKFPYAFPRADMKMLKIVLFGQKDDQISSLDKVKKLLKKCDFEFAEGTDVEVIKFDPITSTIKVDVVGKNYAAWCKLDECFATMGIKTEEDNTGCKTRKVFFRLDDIDVIMIQHTYRKF